MSFEFEHRLENVSGAWALAVADSVRIAVEEASGHSAATPAALTALRIHRGATIEQLAGVLGLSHSGTVRLVDRLELDRLVERRRGRDARAVALELTAKGRRAATRVAGARAAVLAQQLEPLDDDERATLLGLLEKLVQGGVDDWRAVGHRCRMCDLEACHDGGKACPLDHRMAVLGLVAT